MNELDFYRNFDPQFFKKGRPPSLTSPEAAEHYLDFLNENEIILSDLLERNAQPPERIRTALRELVIPEFLHVNQLRYATDTRPLTVTKEQLQTLASVKLRDSQTRYIKGKVHSHLARLMCPQEYSGLFMSLEDMNNPQNPRSLKFGIELLQYAATPKPSLDAHIEADEFCHTFRGDSAATFEFWTLAPYLHLRLKASGLEPNESMAIIVNWAREAYDPKTLDITPPYSLWDRVDHVLGVDDRMPSHLHANLVAGYTTKKLLECS